MQCPLCLDPILDERQSHGIEVDVCPNCGGVWLDRGELEKLIAATPPAPLGVYEPPENPSDSSEERVPSAVAHDKRESNDDDRPEWKSDRRSRDRDDDDDDDDGDDDDDDDERKSKHRKAKSPTQRLGDLLGEVFDDVLDLDDLFD